MYSRGVTRLYITSPMEIKAYMAFRIRVALAVFIIVPALGIAAGALLSVRFQREGRSIPAEGSRMLLGSITDREIPSDEL